MKINLEPEFQYQLYLNQSGLNEATFNKNQKQERRRTFFAAYGMALKACQTEGILNNKGKKIIGAIFKKLADFFSKESMNDNLN